MSEPFPTDMGRFATLFSPATPPATPTTDEPPPVARRRMSTHSSSGSVDFGAFVSVPPAQDPLNSGYTSADPHNQSLVYFDQFTTHAKTAAERSRREVLDELLEHQDDPMYFLDTPSTCSATPIPVPVSTDDALAEALATDMLSPKPVRARRSGSLKLAQGHSRSRLPLPPHLSGTTSPSTGSTISFATSSPTLSSASTPASSAHPAHATLSRISSSLVSLLPATRTRPSSPSIPTIAPSSAPSTIARSHVPTLTHGSPFASTPYIPPTGAPGFAGDRAWDRGFSEALMQEGKRDLADPGFGAETTHGRHAKGKGVTLVGRRQGTVDVLTEEMADLIRSHLPALMKLPRHWTLLYSLDQHGISLNTLYSRSEPRIPSRAHPNPPKGGLLVVQDANDTVFGAWLSEGIRLEKGAYYGSGESFLWRYHLPHGEGQGRLDVYNWTGVNAYVALCESGFLSFGGGDGHYGLYLDASLLNGSSAPCPTFGNPPLCAREKANGEVVKAKGEMSFECVGLEVWAIGSA